MYYHGQGSFLLGGQIKATKNKRKKHFLVNRGQSHGIIVYSDGSPVGWLQYGTREELPRIDASRTYSKLELENGKKTLWRITCFFVDRDARDTGVAGFALKTALSSIRKRGGGIVEAYPLENIEIVPRKTAKGKASFMWSGTVSMFKKLGFKVVARLSKSRRLMRKTIS